MYTTSSTHICMWLCIMKQRYVALYSLLPLSLVFLLSIFCLFRVQNSQHTKKLDLRRFSIKNKFLVNLTIKSESDIVDYPIVIFRIDQRPELLLMSFVFIYGVKLQLSL